MAAAQLPLNMPPGAKREAAMNAASIETIQLIVLLASCIGLLLMIRN
jgi:hypothetical protein